MQVNRFAEKYGSWAMITGASSGLGAEFAEQLAKRGLNLILIARREEKLLKLAAFLEKEHNIRTRTIAQDLTISGACPNIIEKTHDLQIGLLVNNAGFSNTGELLESTTDVEGHMYRVNCEVPFQLTMEFAKQMVQRGRGGIIFVSSSVAKVPVPYWTHYAATKSYILQLGEGLYYELKKKGIDVLTLCPGGMKTEFQTVAGISNFGAMSVKPVALCAMKSLGKKPSVVPGWYNFIAYDLLSRLLPTKAKLTLFGSLMKKLKR